MPPSTESSPESTPEEFSSQDVTTDSPPAFDEVTLGGDDGRTRLVWLTPAIATTLMALLLGGGVYTIYHDADAVPVAGRDVDALNWMYGFALLFLAVVLLPRVVSAPDRIRRLIGRVRTRLVIAACAVYALVVFVIGSVSSVFVSEPRLDPLVSLQPPVWRDIPEAFVPTCHGSVVDGQCQGTFSYPLGTNVGGEDLLAVSLLGLNTSLRVAVTASVIAATLGILVGIAAGYVGNRTDELLMRYVDVQQALPAFFVYIFLILIFSRSYQLLILVFGLLSWGGIARLVRSEVIQLRATPYVQAAQLSGAGSAFIVVRHIVPKVTNTIITAAALLFAKFVVYEAALAFLSLTDPEIYSLGNEIASAVGREDADVVVDGPGMQYNWWTVPWVIYVPAGLLCSFLLAISILGDGLQDVLDPRP